MLLSKDTLKERIRFHEIAFGVDDSGIQPGSIDLTVLDIYEPGEDNIKRGKDHKKIVPGEIVIVQVAEELNIPTDLGGITLPPNSLSKNGLLMTNPGHIDPGFKGHITVCLINMSSETCFLNRGDKIATLLLFCLDKRTVPYSSTVFPGVTAKQLSQLSKDFAGVDNRIKRFISSNVKKNAAVYLTVLATVLTFVLTMSSEVSSIFNLGLGRSVSDLDKKVSRLDDRMAKDIFEMKKEIERLKKNNERLRVQNDILLNKDDGFKSDVLDIENVGE